VGTDAAYAQTPLVIGNQAILFLGDKVQSKNLKTGAVLWTTTIGRQLPEYGIYNTSPVYLADSNIYFTNKRYNGNATVTNNDFISLNLRSGTVNWKTALPLFYDLDLPVQVPVCSDKYAYVAVYNTLYAFDRATGVAAWSFNRGFKYLRNPCIAGNKIYLAADLNVPAEQDTLFALNADNGTIAWAHFCDGFGFNAAPAYGNGKVYVNMDNGVLCMDAASGNELWRSTTPESLSPVFADGNSLFLSANNNATLYSIDAGDGSINWKTEVNPDPWGAHLTEGPAVIGNMVYMKNFNYYGIDKNTGQLIWTAPIPDEDSNPPYIPNLTDANGLPLFYASSGMK